MDVMESGKPPLKDRGNMVTSVVSPKVTEGTNNSDGCTEEIAGKTAELHNGGTQLGTNTDSVVGSKTKKDANENAKKASKQGIEHATSTSEKWKMQFDLSDSASSSDSDGSEVETTDKIGEQHKDGPNTLTDSEMEDAMDFRGFDTDTTSQGYGMVLNKIIDLTENSLKFSSLDLAEASTSHDDNRVMGTNVKETYFHSFISCVDENGMENGEKEEVTFALKINSNPESPLIRDEPMEVNSDIEETNSGQESSKPSHSIESIPRSRSRSNRLDSTDSTNSESRKKKKKKVKEKNESYEEEPSISEEDNMEELSEDRMKVDEMSEDIDRTKVDETTAGVDRTKVDEMSADVDKRKGDEISGDSERTKGDKMLEHADGTKAENTPEVKMDEADRSSNDIAATPAKGDISGIVNEEMSELTSSATSSPSLSSRGSFKLSAASGTSSGGRYSRGVSPALSSSGGRVKKSSVDMSNPAFLKPFEFGWRRELVYRNTSDSSFKKMADIYYYTPAGKKVRSNREVSEYLDGVDLTMENFTFFKEALGLNDPSKEIIRDAKKVALKDPNATPVRKPAKPKLNTSGISPLSDGSAASPSPLSQLATKASPLQRTVPPKTFPKIKVSSVRLHRLPNVKPISKQKKLDTSDDGEMEMGMLPPMWSPSNSPFLKKTAGNSQNATAVTWSAK